jgi:hypothetical protein
MIPLIRACAAGGIAGAQPAHWLPALLCAGLIVGLPACDESLPSRVDPEKVLTYAVSLSSGAITVEGGEVTGGGGLFSLSATNAYDEVLSDRARVIGVITMRLKNHPGSARTLAYTPADLTVPTMLIGATLTINVNQTLTLTHPWDHRADGGVPLWESLAFTRGVTDKGRIFFRSDTAFMQLEGTLQLFEKVQPAKITLREFPVVYTLFDTYIPPPTAKIP